MKKLLLLLLFLSSSFFLAGCQTTTTLTTRVNPDDQYCSINSATGIYVCDMVWSAYFKTDVSLRLYYTATDTYDVSDLYDEVGDLLRLYHQWFDKYNAYSGVENIYTINRDSSVVTGEVFGTKTVSQNLFTALTEVLLAQREIAGEGIELFNVALGPVLQLWHDARESETCTLRNNLTTKVCTPPDETLLSASFNTDSADILLDAEALTLSFAKPGMSLDLGGFGKGYVSEIVADLLDARGVTYLLNAGSSNIKAGGNNPLRETGDYFILLTQPTFTLTNAYFAVLQIPDDLSVVTSGSYQNYFIGSEDDVLYHHIIDPVTHQPGGSQVTLTFSGLDEVVLSPTDAVMSVTVYCEDGGIGDILSTTLYLMTLEEGLAYVEADPDIEAVWYQFDGTITLSSGLSRSTIEVSEGVFKPLIGLAE